jgi:hypothetical protein
MLLTNFNFVGHDRQIRQIHGRVLRKLLGIVGGCQPLQNDSIVPHDHAQFSDSGAQASLNECFQARDIRAVFCVGLSRMRYHQNPPVLDMFELGNGSAITQGYQCLTAAVNARIAKAEQFSREGATQATFSYVKENSCQENFAVYSHCLDSLSSSGSPALPG